MSNNRTPKCWNRQVKRLFIERRQLIRKRRETRQALENQIATSSNMLSNSRSAASASYFKNIAALVPLSKVYDDSGVEYNFDNHANSDSNDKKEDTKEEEQANQLDAEKVSSIDISQPILSSSSSASSPTHNNNSADTLQVSDNSQTPPIQGSYECLYPPSNKDNQDVSSIVEGDLFSEEKGNSCSNPIIVPCEKCIIEEVYDDSKPHCSTRDVRCPFNSVNLPSNDSTSDNIHSEEEGDFGKPTKENDKVSVITDDLKRISI